MNTPGGVTPDTSEGYGIFFIVKKAEYHLRLKSFILETDHNNLRYMEKSLVPRIIRWVTFLQSFTFVIRHIPGKLQVFPAHNILFEEDLSLTILRHEILIIFPSPPSEDEQLVPFSIGSLFCFKLQGTGSVRWCRCLSVRAVSTFLIAPRPA